MTCDPGEGSGLPGDILDGDLLAEPADGSAAALAERLRFGARLQAATGLGSDALGHAGSAAPVAAPPAGASGTGAPLAFRLRYVPPFDWPALLAFLERRSIAGTESVAGECYERTAGPLPGAGGGWIQVTAPAGRAEIIVRMSPGPAAAAPTLLARLRVMLDLGAETARIEAHLGSIAAGAPGLRVPGAFGGFELAVRAILGQQITVRAATTLAGRFAEAFGTAVPASPSGLSRMFPGPEAVAARTEAELGELGIVRVRGRAILALARAIAGGTLHLEPGADPDAQIACLRAVPGVGDWTAQYIAMRALKWADAFPHTDYGVKKALGLSSPREILARAEPWRPWRAYAVMHLWRSLAGTSPAPVRARSK